MSRWQLSGERGQFALGGLLDFDTVAEVFAETERLFTGADAVVLDLSAVEHCNSAALALLLEWRAEARRRRCSIRYLNLPATLLALAQVCETEGLLNPPADEM